MTHADHLEPLDAAAWDARLRRPDCSPDDRARFDAWLKADPENARAFDYLQAILLTLRENAARPQLRAFKDRASRRARPFMAAAAVLIAAIAGVLSAALLMQGSNEIAQAPAPAQQFATEIGERRQVTLEDGSTVTLNTNSAIETAFDQRRRYVRVTSGQAYFDVATEAGRPFVVEAHGRTVTALGTQFDVSVAGARLRVLLVEGSVAVEKPGAFLDFGRERNVLAPGQQLVAASSGEVSVFDADIERLMLWRQGRVSFSDTPLPDAIAEMNRYSATAIVLADPSMSELRVNGVFRTGQQATFVRVLESYYPIEAHLQADGDLLLVWRAREQ